MSSTGFKFDAGQQYQLDAINAVTGLFDGQPADAEKLITNLRGSAIADEALLEDGALDIDLTQEVGAIGNNLILSRELVLSNLQHVQDSTGLEVSSELFDNLKLDFDVEMETGTGKTYVYLRTIFELAQKYNFTKFIILVPSVAIREGVATSIRLMKKHFNELYPSYPFDSSVYSGKNAEEVQSFATSTNVQILIMTMASIAEKAAAGAKGSDDAEARLIINQRRDKLNGFRPIDYLQATHPVVIMDEPQNMEGQLSQEALERLAPSFTLRYSATHKTRRNVIYRLDPVDAHDLGLVKQIVVADVQQQGADAAPYLKLVSVKSSPEFLARLELSVLTADGTYVRREVSVKTGIELSSPKVSSNSAYEGWRINEIRLPMDGQPGSIELTLHGELQEGESIGGATGAIYKEMIRETIREHFRKQKMLKDSGIKVLSLFFVDKVASYMGEGESNDSADGDFAKWFDEAFIEERSIDPKIQELLPQNPADLRKAYFSQIKKGKSVIVQDSSGSTKADDDAYELIMKDKERLLDDDEPVRFIFSHSALREGWDNPNVFQICTLREMGTETQRRQTLGRGLRLPVKKTPTGYERVADRSIATLTVIANESYKSFASSLQKEYKNDGIEIGRVRMNEFARILRQDLDGVATEQPFGFQWSAEVREDLTIRGFITDGVVTDKFTPQIEGFTLDLEDKFTPYETEIIEILGHIGIERYIKPKSNRVARKLNKVIYSTPEFEDFWHAISAKSTYRVKLETPSLVSLSIAAIKDAPEVQALRIQVTKAEVKVLRGGARGQEKGTRISELKGSYDLPDIITELQEATSLTRGTIIDILTGSDRLDEFINNPNDFISMVKRCLLTVLAQTVVGGIEYEKIAGSIYELRELQQDGLEEKERFLDQMYHVQNGDKTDFDYVVFDSDVERQFAEFLDGRDDVKYFMKLPPKFKIPTPVGDYNPDWAIIKREGEKDQIYMIRETKSTNEFAKMRPSEVAKIKSAKKHFEAIGAVRYENNHPGDWKV
jgi:type III restriction enzyme